MNKIIISGRLATQPELKTTQSGLAVCSVRVAVDRGYGDSKATDFFTCVFWRRNAENVSKYLDKGDMIIIDGELQTRQYEGKSGKTTAYEICVQTFNIIPTKKSDTQTETQNMDDLPF